MSFFGKYFNVRIVRYPTTLLGNSFKRKRFWDPKNEEYFFDRHRTRFSFKLILNSPKTNF